MNERNSVVAPSERFWRPGDQYRPAPPRISYRAHWIWPRKRLLEPWMDFEIVPSETELQRVCADHFWQGDEQMDAVVDDFRSLGFTRGREMFEQALADGIEAVDDAPASLRQLFASIDRRPDWFDAEKFEAGRLAVVDSSLAGKTAMAIQDGLGTFVGEEVASAVGATGRFVNDLRVRQLETLEFFYRVTRPAVTDRWSPEFADVLRVRLMHAQARAGLRRSWGEAHFGYWGNPISASMIAGAAMTFGLIPVLFDHAAGRRRDVVELDGAAHYWGYLAHLMGAPDELIPRDWREGLQIMDYMVATAGGPNKWTEQMVGAATRPLDEGASPVSRLLGRAAWWLPQGIVTYYGGESLRRGLFAGTPLEHRRARLSRAAWAGVVTVNITWNRCRDLLPCRAWRTRRRAAHGDATLARQLKLLRSAFSRSGHDIPITWDGHDTSAAIAPGSPIPQVSHRTAATQHRTPGACPMGH